MKRLSIVVALFILLAGAAGWIVARHGFSARAEPWAIEALIARNVRRIAIPGGARALANPVPLDSGTLVHAREHFADHCASCHGNDGQGKTTLGQGLYPKAPDMTQAATQELSDGELFYIIENGIRFTGMPAWGDTHGDGSETWQLVHFIRHLVAITPEEIAEMKALNPQTRSVWAEGSDGREPVSPGVEPALQEATLPEQHDHDHHHH